MYGSMRLHKFFLIPPIFPSENQKRSQLTASHIMAHHLAFLQLLCALTIGQSLAKITQETCPAVQCLFYLTKF